MKSNFKDIGGTILFSLNIFIIFILLFQNRLVIPLWLQPIGRMHPLLLHFPLVLLMVAMVLEFFRFKPAYINQPFYQNFSSNLLIVGSLSSAVTVIMGLFLSKEGGYSGNALLWHQWTGVCITFISSVIYFSRERPWYNGRFAKAGAIVMAFFLIITGHFGATLTHGDNFILEPVSLARKVPVNEALIFKDVIKPILDKKCLSCHNPDKAKGKLLLTDAESILKGGKTGKLFVPGKPQLSLLFKRIHLPPEDKKHMPPAGKVQLTDEEITLLYLWVKSKPDFQKRVVDLPDNDSLRILASTLLKPADDEKEEYDFQSADEQTISKLNSNYRVISPLAKGSPALAVNIYNKGAFTSNSIKELIELKKQIVSLNLNKMPVKDADLKTISKFENLRTLNLNFTDISGRGLKDLSSLQNLKSLSLSGTKLTFSAVKDLNALKNLEKVVLWSTGLNDAEIKLLQKNKRIQFIAGYKDDGSIINKLNPPKIQDPLFVFRESNSLALQHSIPGTNIHYTLDGTDPDSLKSPLYKKPIIITDNKTIKAKAFKRGWAGSNIAIYTFYKSVFKPDSISFLTKPDDMFKGNGAKTLINARSANFGFRSDEWVGFSEGKMAVLMLFKQPVSISAVTLNIMLNPGGFVYPPASVEIWGGNSEKRMRLLKTVKPTRMTKSDTAKVATVKEIECGFKPAAITFLKVIAIPQKLPAGFVTKKEEKPPKVMMLVNEVLIN